MPKPLWDALGEVSACLKGRKVAAFLDYDGTLTPIVERPELAVISPEMQAAVAALTKLCPVAIISGRALRDVEAKVGVTSAIYAGSHGFDIDGPDERKIRNETGAAYIPSIQAAKTLLQDRLADVEGVIIEDKTYSVAVHYRQVADHDVAMVEGVVDEAIARLPDLRKALGKKVFELRPDMEWHKGKALEWLLEALDLKGPDVVPLYIGDDVTDEDAFRELGPRGIGILVAEEPHPTHAPFYLRDTTDVGAFLKWLRELLEERKLSG